MGFSRQERWSRLPFPSPMHESGKWKWSRSVVSDSSRPHELQPTRLLHQWDFPGNSTGVGCHCLLPGRGLEKANGLDAQNRKEVGKSVDWAERCGLYFLWSELPLNVLNREWYKSKKKEMWTLNVYFRFIKYVHITVQPTSRSLFIFLNWNLYPLNTNSLSSWHLHHSTFCLLWIWRCWRPLWGRTESDTTEAT